MVFLAVVSPQCRRRCPPAVRPKLRMNRRSASLMSRLRKTVRPLKKPGFWRGGASDDEGTASETERGFGPMAIPEPRKRERPRRPRAMSLRDEQAVTRARIARAFHDLLSAG